MPISEVFALVKDIIVALAAAVAAIVAVIGLSNWSRELRGRTTFEVARALARSTYKLRDAIENFRTPFLGTSEYPEGYAARGAQSSPREQAEDLAHIYGNRWKNVWSTLQDFDISTLEAEAIWGAAISAKTDALRRCVRELRLGIDYNIKAATSNDHLAKYLEFEREQGSIISTASDEGRVFTAKIESAIQGIETIVRPHLKRG